MTISQLFLLSLDSLQTSSLMFIVPVYCYPHVTSFRAIMGKPSAEGMVQPPQEQTERGKGIIRVGWRRLLVFSYGKQQQCQRNTF